MPHTNFSPSLLLSLSLSLLLPALAAAQPPDDPPGRWQLETLTLRDESKLTGLIQSQTEREIDFAQIIQPPGMPMYVVIRGIPRSEVTKIERLPLEHHQQLVQRLARFRHRAIIEAGRMDEVKFISSEGDAQRLVYAGPWFSLTSTADDEQTRRSVVRIEQIFRAYRTLLPPRVVRPEPLAIELFGSLDQYRARLRMLGLDLKNAAIYSPAERTILAGSDLNLFADRLAQVRREHERVKKDVVRLEAEYNKSLATLTGDLKAAGFTAEEITAEVRLRRAVWKEEMDTLLAANLQRQRTNDQKYNEVTGQMFARLDHEAFHAYLDTFVYPHGRHQVPRWLNEGLAQVFESGQFDGESLRIDAPDKTRLAALQAELSTGEPLSLVRLLRADEREFLGPHGAGVPARHYLYSWGLAYWLAFDQNLLGTAKLDEYVALASGNNDPVARFEKLVGQPLAPFERAWRKGMLER